MSSYYIVNLGFLLGFLLLIHNAGGSAVVYNMMQTFCPLYKRLLYPMCTQNKATLLSVQNNFDTLGIILKKYIDFFKFSFWFLLFQFVKHICSCSVKYVYPAGLDRKATDWFIYPGSRTKNGTKNGTDGKRKIWYKFIYLIKV